MHQSGPNTSGMNGQPEQPPRWAFLVAFDPAHNATQRQAHPAFPDRPMHEQPMRSTGSSPVLDDELVLEYGRQHLEAARSHIEHAAAKRQKKAAESAAKL
jgi:hypothetical protein